MNSMSVKLKSDKELKKNAEAFFEAARLAVADTEEKRKKLFREGHFYMRNDVLFDTNATVTNALHQLISITVKLLGTKKAHEKEISEMAWEFAFEYVSGKHTSIDAKGVTKEFIEGLLKHIDNDFQWIAPNHVILFRDQTQRIQIGPVEALTFDELINEMSNDPNKHLKLTKGDRFKVEGNEFQFPPICWRVNVQSAQGHVEEEATWLINIALSLLRLSYPDEPYFPMYPHIGDIEASPIVQHVFSNCGIKKSGDNILGGGSTAPRLYEVNDSVRAITETQAFKEKANAIFNPSAKSIAERFGHGLGWLTRGRQTKDRAERFLYYFTAIEALLSSEDKSDPVIQTIVRNITVILVEDVTHRSKVAKTIKSLYALRSALVHNGKRSVSISDMNTLQYIAENLFAAVLTLVDMKTSFVRFQNSLSEASYGLIWEFSKKSNSPILEGN